MTRTFLAHARLQKQFWYMAIREAANRVNIPSVSSNPDDPTDLASMTKPNFEF